MEATDGSNQRRFVMMRTKETIIPAATGTLERKSAKHHQRHPSMINPQPRKETKAKMQQRRRRGQ
jgi:hypothetical protein